VLVVLAAVAAGQEQERPSFSGTWQFDASKSELHSSKISSATWVIEEGDNSIHISQTENGKPKKTELQCTTDGKECKFPGDRRDSFWYNGPMLVDMETKNDHVTRFRMKISDDGKTLTVEVTPIVPQSDKIDTLVFQK
jgi:putative lipoic acid-binding regulatory protein